jgi:S1-C subfamily serine protease
MFYDFLSVAISNPLALIIASISTLIGGWAAFSYFYEILPSKNKRDILLGIAIIGVGTFIGISYFYPEIYKVISSESINLEKSTTVVASNVYERNHNVKKGIVKITSNRNVGTGFAVQIFEERGYIVTAVHVIEGDPNPTIKFWGNDESYKVTVLNTEAAYNPEKGLALLLIKGKDILEKILPLNLSEENLKYFSSDLEKRDNVIFTYGFPRGGANWAYTPLTYSGQKGRDLLFLGNINEGNSGGPLIKKDKVIGMITMRGQFVHAISALTIREFLQGSDISLLPQKSAVSPNTPTDPVNSNFLLFLIILIVILIITIVILTIVVLKQHHKLSSIREGRLTTDVMTVNNRDADIQEFGISKNRDDKLKKFITREISNSTVKIFVEGEFHGTGFFITPDGYLLTAYHVIGDFSHDIHIETRFGEKFSVELDEAKSLKHYDYDIAVLRVYQNSQHYLPLGTITHQQITDDVVAIGYPAGDRTKHDEISFFISKISQIRSDNKVQIPNAIKGRGQSGGPIYHYASKRVIGLVTEGYNPDVIMDTGLAIRFEALFEKWYELEAINNRVAQSWDEHLENFLKNS